MKKNIDLLLCLFFTIGSIVSVYFVVPVLTPFVKFVSLIIFPGWLLNEIIFYDFKKLHLILQILLIYIIGSILTAAELWILILIRVQIVSGSVVILGVSLTLALQLAVLIKRQTTKQKAISRPPFEGLISLGISISLMIVISFLVWYSIPVSQEAYTEFYVQNEKFVSPNFYEGNLFIINHEKDLETYTIRCTDSSGNLITVIQIPLQQVSIAEIHYRVQGSGSEQESKLRMDLYHQQDVFTYRNIEILGESCKDIKILGYTIK